MNLLTKIMQFIHRILGTALSILFLVWFLSGLVMIYHTFPRADRADKRAKMDILSPENLPSLDQIEKRLTAIWDKLFFISGRRKGVMIFLPTRRKDYP